MVGQLRDEFVGGFVESYHGAGTQGVGQAHEGLDLVADTAGTLQEADRRVGLNGNGEFVQRTNPSADTDHGVAGGDQQRIAADIVQAGVNDAVIGQDRQAVLHDMLDLGGRRADADAHLAAGFLVGFGGIVRQTDRGAGHQGMASLGDSLPQFSRQHFAFFDTFAFGGARYAYLVHGVSYTNAVSVASCGCSSANIVCSTGSCRK